MSQAQAQAAFTSQVVAAAITPGSLREEMETRRANGSYFEVSEVIGIVVPLCTQLAELHAQGKSLYAHPSSVAYMDDGTVHVIEELAHTPPELPRDRACLAPEERKGGTEGNAQSSVFAIGAMLYELLTNESVGPGMRRPSELVADLPPELELVLGKSLIADPKHRPADLAALAQALYQVAPGTSVPPPPADASNLDEGIDVDVSLSMIPPPPSRPVSMGIPHAPLPANLQAVSGDGPFAVAIPVPKVVELRADDPTQKLAELKASLEADERPRYVVRKDGMDHGPFSAVELLQQIATGTFMKEHVLRDAISDEERFIQDWPQFAQFAEQAKLNQDIVQEKKALDATVTSEKQRTQYKALIGIGLMAVIAAGAAGWWLKERAKKEHELTVKDATDKIAVETDAALSAKAGTPGLGGGRSPGGGNYPVLGGGMSCEAARARYVEEYKIGNNGAPDLTAGAYGNVLNRGTYLNACGVPSTMEVTVCAAVQNGRAVGVTVSTSPPNAGISSCVAGAVRGLSFPSHPRLDVATTTFK